MLTVKDIIKRIRASTSDKQEIGYTDNDLLGYINDGLRFVRRIIIEMLPDLLSEMQTGTLAPGEQIIQTDCLFTRLIEVRIDNRLLAPMLRRQATTDSGRPISYCVAGFNKIELYPTPNEAVDYGIIFVRDMSLLTLEDASPFPNDFDDFLIEYAVIRASIKNEFDISQEASVFARLTSQIETMIRNIRPSETSTDGYWDGSVYTDLME